MSRAIRVNRILASALGMLNACYGRCEVVVDRPV